MRKSKDQDRNPGEYQLLRREEGDPEKESLYSQVKPRANGAVRVRGGGHVQRSVTRVKCC